MAYGIRLYSTTAASNNAAVPGGAPEGWFPSDVNNWGRQVMADIRTWYQDAEWVDFGNTPTRTGNTTFTVTGDQTLIYLAGRRIKCTDSSTLYGIIVSAVFGALTTVTVTLDSGNLSISLTAVAVGVVSVPAGGTNSSLSSTALGNVVGVASSVDGEMALFNSTGGKTIKRSTLTGGILKSISGIPAIATADSDYTANAFKTISVSGQSDIVADSAADTLTIVAGTGITLTTNAGTDTLTVTNSVSAGVFTVSFQSSAITMTAGTGSTVAHSLGGRPKIIYGYIRCISAELNYAVGDEVPIPMETNNYGINAWSSGTANIGYWIGTNLRIPNATSGGDSDITYSKWEYRIRAYA